MVGRAVLCVHFRTKKTGSTVRFYPYCGQIAFVWMFAVMYIIVIIIMIFAFNIFILIFTIISFIFVVYFLRVFYALTQLEVTFDRDGVRLYNCRAKNSWYAKWESFAAGYWIYTSDGRASLLLVTHPMDKEEREQMYFVLNTIVHGRRVLAVEGHTFFLADAVRKEITAMIDGKFPIYDEIELRR